MDLGPRVSGVGVVVGAQDLGEDDRLVRLLTPHLGRIALIARRARATPRQWAGLLDLGTQLSFQLRAGRGELRVIASAERLSSPMRARDELERIALLTYGGELCAALAPEGGEAIALYRLLCTWLDLLEGDATPGAPSVLALEAKALTFAGLMPNLERCSRCDEPLEEPLRFDPEAGGALHLRCGAGETITLAHLQAIARLRRTPLAETTALTEPSLSRVLANFVEHQARRPLRSRSLVEDLLGAR